MQSCPHQIQTLTFGAHELDVLHEEDKVWVSIRRVCEGLGLDFSTQLRKLKSAEWSELSKRDALAPDGRVYPTVMLEHRKLPIWPASVQLSRVGLGLPPETREMLKDRIRWFQAEAAEVLADHFLGRRVGGKPMSLAMANTHCRIGTLLHRLEQAEEDPDVRSRLHDRVLDHAWALSAVLVHGVPVEAPEAQTSQLTMTTVH